MDKDEPLKDNKNTLTKKVDELAKKYMQRSRERAEEEIKNKKKDETYNKEKNKVVELPFCKDSERTIPNIIARSALFGVIKRGSRSYKEKELIASRDDIKIYYTGKTLDQADCTVWMQTLAFASKLGERIKINRSGFLKELGKTTGKKDYEWLDASLTRLMTGIVTVYTKKYRLEFHLIDIWGKFMNEDSPVEYILKISPEVINMWSNSEYTRVEWDKRLAIRHGNDLASWMQLYIRSNTTNGKAHHIGLDKLKNWCGLSKMRLDHFRTGMRKSLSELLRIGEVEEATIRDLDDMVIFRRKINHRDSNTLEHRDSNTNYRDSNTNYRDSNTNYRDSNTKHVSKSLIIKDFFRRFFA